MVCCSSCNIKLKDNLTSQKELEQLFSDIESNTTLRENIFAINTTINSEYTIQIIPRNTNFLLRGSNENGYLLLIDEYELKLDTLETILKSKFSELQLEPRTLLRYPVNSNIKNLNQESLDTILTGKTNYLHIGLNVNNVVEIFVALITHLNPNNHKNISFNINKRDER
jgi:hypothetical protein